MCNRLFRSKSKQYIRKGKELPYRLREVMNVWNFAGDGKVYWGYDWQGVEKLMRKELNIFPFALSCRGEDVLNDPLKQIITYFPMQNFPKIFPNISSLLICPVISPK